MDVDAKISSCYQSYKAEFKAAKITEQKGNIEAACKLYKRAARNLCEMAQLETGEIRRQRVMHAESIMKKAKELEESKPVSMRKPSDNSSATATRTVQNDTDDDNPWVSEGIPSTTFDDVIGMEDVKKLIRERVIDQIMFPELYEQFGVKGGTGLLLFGLPGTGKTTIARAIAHEIGAPLYTVQLSDVLNKWLGESEKRISQLFDKARSTPTALIFFDDFDALGMARTDDGNHNNKIIVELINQIQGFHKNDNTIVLLAATNRPWMIDSALLRGGRFEHHIYVPLPNHEARIMLTKKRLGTAPVDPDIDMDCVSNLFSGYNGADVVSVVDSAKVTALQRSKEHYRQNGENILSAVTFDDFARAAANHKSSVNANDITQMRNYAAERDIALPDEM